MSRAAYALVFVFTSESEAAATPPTCKGDACKSADGTGLLQARAGGNRSWSLLTETDVETRQDLELQTTADTNRSAVSSMGIPWSDWYPTYPRRRRTTGSVEVESPIVQPKGVREWRRRAPGEQQQRLPDAESRKGWSGLWCSEASINDATLGNGVQSSLLECIKSCQSHRHCTFVGFRTNDNYCEFWTAGSCAHPNSKLGHELYRIHHDSYHGVTSTGVLGPCVRPSGWCTDWGKYEHIDCDGDGIKDHRCSLNGWQKVISSKAGCEDSYPNGHGTCKTSTVDIRPYTVKRDTWCNANAKVAPRHGKESGVKSGLGMCIRHCEYSKYCEMVGFRATDNYCELWSARNCPSTEHRPNHYAYELKQNFRMREHGGLQPSLVLADAWCTRDQIRPAYDVESLGDGARSDLSKCVHLCQAHPACGQIGFRYSDNSCELWEGESCTWKNAFALEGHLVVSVPQSSFLIEFPPTTVWTPQQAVPTDLDGVDVQHHGRWCNNDKVMVPSGGIGDLTSGDKYDLNQCIRLCREHASCEWVGIKTVDGYCEFWQAGSCKSPHAQPGHDIYHVIMAPTPSPTSPTNRPHNWGGPRSR